MKKSMNPHFKTTSFTAKEVRLLERNGVAPNELL